MKSAFQGFQVPFYTMVPNELLDELMVDLTGGELKVALYVCRRTFGFGKREDGISLAQMLGGVVTKEGRRLDRGCGLKSRSTLLLTLRSLIAKRILRAVRQQSARKGNEATLYCLNLTETRKDAPLGPKIGPRGGPKISPTPGPKIGPSCGCQPPPPSNLRSQTESWWLTCRRCQRSPGGLQRRHVCQTHERRTRTGDSRSSLYVQNSIFIDTTLLRYSGPLDCIVGVQIV
jgi:hypothetical protein